jgi:Spy/CpxP family protein refolding chaperone
MGAVAVLTLCAVVGFARSVKADPTGGSPSPSQRHGVRQARREKQFVRFCKNLNLTEDQQEKIKPIFADQAEQLRAVSSDKSLTKPDKQEKFKTIHTATEEKIEPLLTPDQMEKWGAWKQKMWDRTAARREQKQDRADNQGKWHNHRHGSQEFNWQARFEQFSKTLSLTEDQQEKIKPIFADQAEQFKAVYNDKSLSKEDRQERFKTIRSVTEEKIEPLLAPDQMEKWGAWKLQGGDRAVEQREHETDAVQDSDHKTDTK